MVRCTPHRSTPCATTPRSARWSPRTAPPGWSLPAKTGSRSDAAAHHVAGRHGDRPRRPGQRSLARHRRGHPRTADRLRSRGVHLPSWYAAKAEHGKVVPTWNYSAVHLTGTVRVHQDVEWIRRAVTELTTPTSRGATTLAGHRRTGALRRGATARHRRHRVHGHRGRGQGQAQPEPFGRRPGRRHRRATRGRSRRAPRCRGPCRRGGDGRAARSAARPVTERLTSAVPATDGEVGLRKRKPTSPVRSVEVAGIEPASSVASTGLLRAQCAVSLLGPTGHAHKPVRRAQPL